MIKRIKISNRWTDKEKEGLVTLIKRRLNELTETKLKETEKNLTGSIHKSAIEVLLRRAVEKRKRFSALLRKVEKLSATALERKRKVFSEFVLPKEKKKKINNKKICSRK